MVNRIQSLLRQLLPVAEFHLHNTNMADTISSLRISKYLISANSTYLPDNFRFILFGLNKDHRYKRHKSKCFGAEHLKHVPHYNNNVW